MNRIKKEFIWNSIMMQLVFGLGFGFTSLIEDEILVSIGFVITGIILVSFVLILTIYRLSRWDRYK